MKLILIKIMRMEKGKLEILILTNKILKSFPKFFGDYSNWEYENGKNAGRDFKFIYQKAFKLNKLLKQENL